MAARFAAYVGGKGTIIIGPTHDSAPGTLGTIKAHSDPIVEADDLLVLEEKAFAHLGRHAGDEVFIADSEGRIVRTTAMPNASECPPRQF